MEDFKDALNKEGYNLNYFDDIVFKKEIKDLFQINDDLVEEIYNCNITYKVENAKGLIDYLDKISIFDNCHNELVSSLKNIEILHIERVEYDREPRIQEDVGHIIEEVENIKRKVLQSISAKNKQKLEQIEREIKDKYLYAKDIELLKTILISNNEEVIETYNEDSKIRRVSIKLPPEINKEYIKSQKGSVEYYQCMERNIPRMKRIVRNIHKYIQFEGNSQSVGNINQSAALQDSINIAFAEFDNKEFKAISGSDEIIDFCPSPPKEEAVFISNKVNRLGKLGIGYDRINDSEKKIFEEINKQIEGKILKNSGEIILYSKWEPCPSCYYVMSQFSKRHPHISMQIQYINPYGEIDG